MLNLLRRYFVCNPAPILHIMRARHRWGIYIPCRTGNSGGFYWGYWRVTWRKPYADCWQFNPSCRRWEIAP